MRLIPLFSLVLAALLQPLAADPVISEFVASNQNGLQDEDGDRSDWVEIHNPDPVPVDLSDWYLTDNAANKTKWRFPAVTVPAGGHLVVFASSKDRRVAGLPLHTNFALSAGGEYLGLIRPDGVTVASQFDPSFPAQFPDLSYGTPSNVALATFFSQTATCQWIVPTSTANPASTWRDPGFSAAGWNSAPLGIGFDTNTASVSYLPEIGAGGNTQAAMQAAANPTAYVRIPFTLAVGTEVVSLKLRVKYDDGFAAWLNGQPLLSGGVQVRRNAPASLVWNSSATGTQPQDADSLVFVDFDVTESAGLLVEGDNVLAVQALNNGTSSSDMLFRPELVGEVTAAGSAGDPGYFSTPTPGARNGGSGSMVIPQNVTFSRESGTFTGTFNLTLGGAVAGQEIRYTTDGSLPTATSALYGAPLNVTTSTVVRARIVAPATGSLGFVSARQYELMNASVANYAGSGQPFKSALPLLVLNNRGGGEIGDAEENVRIQVYDRDATGFASLDPTTVPTLTLNASINLRGRSSAGFPKKSYNIEVRNENDAETDVELLGMPAGSDWALVGCYNFDRAFSRNAWIYEMSRRLGRWAPRTRLVEVIFNQNGNGLSFITNNNNANNDYRGVYILVETIRRGTDRVDVAAMDSSETTLPGVSGGYIFKVDAPESDEYSWKTNRNLPPAGTGGDNLVIHRPKLADLAPQQSTYLRDHFQAFEDALFTEAAGGFATRTYRSYIDSTAWADHNLLNGLAQNVDALRLSAYFHKDRGGKMAAGPLWDFDRSVNSTDGRDDNPTAWRGGGDSTDYFTFAWWQQLFQDQDFRQIYVDRWQTLRDGPLATAEIHAVLDGYLAEFRPADTDNPAERDYARWYGGAGSNDITTEINVMKNWLSSRTVWIDGQFTARPTIVRPSGPVAAGLSTTLVVPSGTTLYYTVDGSDPRAEGGAPSPTASVYTGAIPIPATMQLRVRAWRAGSYAAPATNWSAPVEALYLVDESYATAESLTVSAIHYNPLAPDAAEAAVLPEAVAGDFEWIELKNSSAGAINLAGVSFGDGAPFPALTLPAYTLAPGERAVVARNTDAFALRHGAAAAARVVATWAGDAGLDNAGETIELYDYQGGVIAGLVYDDEGDWPERADGDGSALEYTGPTGLAAEYENPFLWSSSSTVHGSPGVDRAGAVGSVVVNEIHAQPLDPDLDAIELHNAGAAAADISGWFLSQAAGPLSADDLRTFRIPDGTVIPAGGHVVFDASDFSPAGEMPLDGFRGGKLWLVSADPLSGELQRFEQETGWTPLLAGVSYGRWPDGGGGFAPLSAYTPGGPNAEPRVGPVQVTEIHYHPFGGTPEYVEIANVSSAPEPLGGWTLRGDVDLDFAAGLVLAPAEAVVAVAFDPVAQPALAASFRSQYGVPAPVRLIGPWAAGNALGDSGGTVRLRRKVPAPPDEPFFVGLMVEDEVNYLAAAPWPETAAGTGSSIRRLGIRRQGSDPAAWVAEAPAPGAGVGGYTAWQFGLIGDVPEGAAEADPDGDGLVNLVEYLLGSDPLVPGGVVTGIDPNGGSPRLVLDYSVRTDRDDAVLSATQSDDLEDWIPAEHDGPLSTDGITEQRRAWLPLGEKGFLRLEAEQVP
jgi:hypothetical protein